VDIQSAKSYLNANTVRRASTHLSALTRFATNGIRDVRGRVALSAPISGIRRRRPALPPGRLARPAFPRFPRPPRRGDARNVPRLKDFLDAQIRAFLRATRSGFATISRAGANGSPLPSAQAELSMPGRGSKAARSPVVMNAAKRPRTREARPEDLRCPSVRPSEAEEARLMAVAEDMSLDLCKVDPSLRLGAARRCARVKSHKVAAR
jgi:hypothetical protein